MRRCRHDRTMERRDNAAALSWATSRTLCRIYPSGPAAPRSARMTRGSHGGRGDGGKRSANAVSDGVARGLVASIGVGSAREHGPCRKAFSAVRTPG